MHDIFLQSFLSAALGSYKSWLGVYGILYLAGLVDLTMVFLGDSFEDLPFFPNQESLYPSFQCQLEIYNGHLYCLCFHLCPAVEDWKEIKTNKCKIMHWKDLIRLIWKFTAFLSAQKRHWRNQVVCRSTQDICILNFCLMKMGSET